MAGCFFFGIITTGALTACSSKLLFLSFFCWRGTTTLSLAVKNALQMKSMIVFTCLVQDCLRRTESEDSLLCCKAFKLSSEKIVPARQINPIFDTFWK